MDQPSEKSIKRMRIYVEKYMQKTGTSGHPEAEVTESVILGLANNIDAVGRPLCPCNFYPDKKAEVERSREWVCACDEMKKWKYCHCLLFVTPEGLPIELPSICPKTTRAVKSTASSKTRRRARAESWQTKTSRKRPAVLSHR